MNQKNANRNMKTKRNINEKISSKALISHDFFPESISINENKVFPMVVMATMSSGKSTLINSLLGQDILPSRNAACTAKKYAILDDDQENSTKIYVTYKNGNTKVMEENIAEELDKANDDDNVTDILIRGHVKGVLNTDKALLIIDTPGPNNSRDESHEQTMWDVIRKIKGGLFLYVLNATLLETYDDKELLQTIKDFIKNNPKVSLLFVINKVDLLDEERGETVEQLMLNVKKYLTKNGIENPQIIPVSALAASVLKKVMNKEQLTRKELRDFEMYYDIYQPKDFSLRSFAITDALADQNKKIEVCGEEYTIGNLNRAIENTGIKLLEEEIQKAQILSSGVIKNTIKISRRKRQ